MIFIIICYILLLFYFPNLVDNTAVKSIPLFLFIFLLLKYANKLDSKSTFFIKSNLTVILLLFVILFDTLRSGNSNVSVLTNIAKGSLVFIFVMVIFYVLNFYLIKRKVPILTLFYNINIIPFVIYATINILFWALHIQVKSTEEVQIGNAVMLSFLGISLERVTFPLASGINSYGTLVGAMLTIVMMLYFNYRKKRMFSLFAIILFFVTLLLTDTRSAIIYPVIITFLVTILIRRKKPINRVLLNMIPLIPIIGPFLLLGFLAFLSTTSLGIYFARSSEDLATGNSRLLIWTYSLTHFMKFSPIHIIGYGEFGHYISGVSKNWGFMFGQWENADLTHPHNTVLSILFDYGYLGLSLFLWYQYKIIKKIATLWTTHRLLAGCVISYLIYFNIIGITESFFGFYYQNSIYLYFSITLFLYYLNSKSKSGILNINRNPTL